MRDMVAGVPGVEQRSNFYGLASAFRVNEGAPPLLGLKRLQQYDPARMQRFDELERPLDGGDRVMQIGPGGFVVGHDGGIVFRQCEANADEGVHVAVGNVVDELADGPAAFAVGRIQLDLVELGAGVAQVFGQLGERPQGGLEQAFLKGLASSRPVEAADRITGVGRSRGRGFGTRFGTHGLDRSTLAFTPGMHLRAERRMSMRSAWLLAGSAALVVLACGKQARSAKPYALFGAATEDRQAEHREAGEFVGFDRNDYPGDSRLAELHQRFAFAGFWLNNPPGASTNSWAGKRQALRGAGFGFLVLWNGRLDAEILRAQKSGTTPAVLGQRDAVAALAAARREGFPAGTILFLDQEEGGRLLPEQAGYFFAWTEQVGASVYKPGAYLSGQPSPDGTSPNGARLTITTAQDAREQIAARHLHPVVFWVAQDACPPAPGCVVKAPQLKDSGTADALVWQYAQSPRRPDLTRTCAATYAPDGNCYGGASKDLFLDLNVARSPDPSRGR